MLHSSRFRLLLSEWVVTLERMSEASMTYGEAAVLSGAQLLELAVETLLAEVPVEKIFVSLERRMHCGRGKCCRCNIGSTYTCLDGPVFDYWSVLNLKEAI